MEQNSDMIPVTRRQTNQSPQVYVMQAVKSAVQNKIIEKERHPKNKTFIRHKPLYAMKNGPLRKTRKREGAIEPALRFCEQRKHLVNRSSNSHPKSESFYLTQIRVCHGERSGVQNKKTDRGPMKNESQ